MQVLFPFEQDFLPGVASVSRLRIFSADQVFLGRKGQNNHCEISGTTFYTFYVSPHFLLRLSKSFQSPQLHFFSIEIQKECSVSNAPCRMSSFTLIIFEVKSVKKKLNSDRVKRHENQGTELIFRPNNSIR